MASAGDVNGDGSPTSSSLVPEDGVGAHYVYLGGEGGPSPTPVVVSDASGPVGRVASAGDVNGDGFADILVGASELTSDTGQRNTGAAYVYFGAQAAIERASP